MRSSLQHNFSLFILLLVLWPLRPAPASAAVSWNVAERKDEEILNLTRQLEKKTANYPHLTDEAVFVLFQDNVHDITFETRTITYNKLFRIQRAAAVDLPSDELSLNSKHDIKSRDAWIQRDKKIIRLGDEVWRLVKGDGNRQSQLYFTFPELKDGDVVGYSVRYKSNEGWGGGYLYPSGPLPVMMDRTRVRTKGEIAYRIMGYHLRKGKWFQKINEKQHGAPCDVTVTIADIPREPSGPFAPSYAEYEPYLVVSYRGNWSQQMGCWFYTVSWNESTYWEHKIRETMDEEAPTIVAQVAPMLYGETTTAGKVDVLHRFVRDEVMTISSLEIREDDRKLKDMLADRQATTPEKGLLLYAMCKAAGIDVDLLVGRDRLIGEIDKGNPNRMQLVDYVVRLPGDPPLYYTPQFADAAAGQLPPQMRGVEVLAVPADMEQSPRDIMWEIQKDIGGRFELVWNQYREAITKVDWAQWEVTPGDPAELSASSVETIAVDGGSGETGIAVQVSGTSWLQNHFRGGGSEEERLKEYCDQRLPSFDVRDANVEFTDHLADTLRVAARIDLDPLPAPMGDEWILPAERVFGKPVLSAWKSGVGDPFLVRSTERYALVWRTPLPAGWDTFRHIAGFEASHERVGYQCTIFQEGRDLVVVRSLQLNYGITMYSDLPSFREFVDKIQAFERNPLLLQRTES